LVQTVHQICLSWLYRHVAVSSGVLLPALLHFEPPVLPWSCYVSV
jgi:hypothetical protein